MLLSALQVNTCFQNLYTFLLEMEEGEMEEGEKGGGEGGEEMKRHFCSKCRRFHAKKDTTQC